MSDDFLFGMKFDFDPSGFLKGSEQAQDQLEKTVAAIAHARRRSQEETEALAKSLSLAPEEVRKALADLDKAQRNSDKETERRKALMERQQAERHRREIDGIRERTQAVNTLRDAMLGAAAVTIGGHGVSGIVGMVTGTAQSGMDQMKFAERAHISLRQSLAEQEGAYLSGLSTREEARQSIGAYANAKNENDQTGHSSLVDTFRRNSVQVGPEFFRMGHEAALRNVVEQMQGLGYSTQRQMYILEQSGLTSGGYTNLAVHPDEMRRYNKQGADRTRREADNINEDIKFGRAQRNLFSDVNQFRKDISHELMPWLDQLDIFVNKADQIALAHPDLARGAVAATAAIVALGGLFSAAATVVGPLLALRAIMAAGGVAAEAGGAAAAGGGAAAAGAGVGASLLTRLAPLLGLVIPTANMGNENTAFLTPTAAGGTKLTPDQQAAGRAQAMKYWASQGWGANQVAGLAARFNLESGFDAFSVGDKGTAYGIGQWHKDRQDNYASVFGHTMQSVTDRAQALREQLQFSQWELTHTDGMNGGGSMGRMLAGARSSDDAARMVSMNYIRPGIGYAKTAESIHTQALARTYLPSASAATASMGVGAVTHDNSIHVGQLTVKANDPAEMRRQLSMQTSSTGRVANRGQI